MGKMTKKKIIVLFIDVVILFTFNIIIYGSKKISDYGMVYLFYSLFVFFCLVIIQRKILTPINILFGTFILFQTGIPIAYYLDKNFYSYYITLFSTDTVLEGAKYTLWSIETFSTVMILMINPRNNKRKKILFSKVAVLNDNSHVYFIARIFFIITSAVILPLFAYVAFLSVRLGFSQEIRSIISSNSFFKLIKAFFFPSFFLLICYAKEKQFTKVATYIFLTTCILALLSGNRTDGILWMITYFYYNKTLQRNTFFNRLGIMLGVVGIIIVAVFIGQTRLGTDSFNISVALFNLIEEMGFNFYSICFVMMYVPSSRDFLYGLSYLESIVCMFPKSLDFLHILDSMRNSLPAQWLWDINHDRFAGLLDFGTGFSMVAESYMNFAWAGFFVSGLYAFLICKIFNGEWKEDNDWEKYIQMTVFLGLLTLPRRGVIDFLTIISYSIFFLTLFMVITYQRKKNI